MKDSPTAALARELLARGVPPRDVSAAITAAVEARLDAAWAEQEERP